MLNPLYIQRFNFMMFSGLALLQSLMCLLIYNSSKPSLSYTQDVFGTALLTRDDHYPVCRLDIWQDSQFATGYGYPNCFQTWYGYGSGYPKSFYPYFEDSDFWKICSLHNHSFIIFRSVFSAFCAMTPESVYGVISVP